MSKNILTYYIVVCLLNISCGSNEKNKQTDPDQEKDESSEINESTSIEEEVLVDNSSTLAHVDTLTYINTFNETFILNPGTYHQDEIDTNWKKLEWFGLFEGYEGDQMFGIYKRVKLQFKPIHDPIIDNEGEMSGIEITYIADHGDSNLEVYPKLLISSMDIYEDKKITFENLIKTSLIPGDSILINDYIFKAIGDIDENEIIRNYELLICGNKEGVYIEDTFLQIEFFDDAISNFIWIADIDNDNIPDVYMDKTNHYNVSNPALYVSSLAKNDRLLYLLTEFRLVGC